MSWSAILFILIGASAGGFINGLAGSGTALFALGFILVALDPVSAVALVTLMSVVTGFQGLWEVRSALSRNVPRLMRFILPGIAGVPVGVGLLSLIDAETLKLIIAIFLILYGGFFSFRANLPKFDRRTPVIDSTIALVGGVLGGMASLSGALPMMWLSMRPWPKAETRALLQPFNMSVLGSTTLMLWWRGAYDPQTVTAFLIALPVSLLSAQIGLMVFRRITDDMFRRLLIGLSLLLGLGILIRALV